MKDGATPSESVTSIFSGTTGWVVAIVAIVLVLCAIGVGLFLWYKKRKLGPSSAASTQAQPPVSGAKNELAHLWKTFLAKLPEAAKNYPVYVVLGDAGAGKSTLVDNHVDWKGQAAQFLPSEVKNPKVQFYVGDDILVQEVSAPVLRDTSDETKEALTELWNLLGAQRPTVVLAVNPNALLDASPDAAKELGKLVRGKINLLSGLRNNATIQTRLCLTHADTMAGYKELASVLRARGKTDPLNIGEDTSGAGLARCLDPWENELTYSLTSQPVDEFKAVVRFFGTSRRMFDALSPFVRAVSEPDDLSTAPNLNKLYFTAFSSTDNLGEPFAIDRNQIEADVQRAESNLRTYCLAALVLVGVVTAGLYTYQGYELRQARSAVDKFVKAAQGNPTTVSAADLDAAERAAGERLKILARVEKLPLFKYSFATDKKQIRSAFTDTVRTAYLLPLMNRRLDASRLAYAMGLLYAADGNDLGDLVEKDPALWALMLGIPDSVPTDYVGASPEAYPDVVAAEPATNSKVPAAATDLKVWYTYLTRLSGAFRSEDIAATELKSLQDDAGPLVAVLRQAQNFSTTKAAIDILSRDKRLNTAALFGSLGTDTTTPTWVAENQETLSSVLTLILTSRLPSVQVEGLSLQQMLGLLEPAPAPAMPPAASASGSTSTSGSASASASAAPAGSALASASPVASASASASTPSTTPKASPTYTLVLSDTTFVFGTSTWADVLLRSRTAAIVVSFIDVNRKAGRYPFFAGNPATYLSVGAAAVPGKGPSRSIAGIFTKTAFDAEVKPVLLTFDQTVSATALGTSRRRTLTDYVTAESSRYANAYSSELKSYFASYEWSAPTPEALAFDMGQLSVPGTWFSSFLSTIATNSTLDVTVGNPYLQPLATNLAAFKPLVTANAQLDKYAAILGKMLPPAAAPPPPGQPASLADKLSPTGMAALSMIKKEPTSAFLQLQPWLDSVGLDNTWSGPFLKPVYSAYNFGVSNINQVVSDAWRKEVYADVQPLLVQFPFDPKATAEATATDMDERIGTKGSFWSDFERLIAPVCLVSNGRYVPLSSALRFPTGMLDTVNTLLLTKATLWDKGGKPQPLALSIRAMPFPAPRSGEPAVTLAQLQTGELSVYGFNQTPVFQPLSLVWSKQGTSAVLVQVSAPNTSGTTVQTQSTPPATSAWSFYRLLLQADPPTQLVWTWHLPVDNTGTKTSPVSFSMASDPWAIFVVPTSP